MAPHLLFNIHTKEEWNEHLIPKLKIIISSINGDMIVIGGEDYPITRLSLKKNKVRWIQDGKEIRDEFHDFRLLDDEDRILFEKTQYLADLYNEIFKN